MRSGSADDAEGEPEAAEQRVAVRQSGTQHHPHRVAQNEFERVRVHAGDRGGRVETVVLLMDSLTSPE
jgi:hypothetical protein